ncbi:MAG TPA: hypothetical protein VFR02_00135 [bacterium]|nr:hypothetical protein [bacterium]
MEAQPDFKELFALLNRHKAEFIIVGAYALAYHGIPRNTGDIDVYVRPTALNARRVLAALGDFGFKALGLTEADFQRPGNIIQLGVPPVRVDFLTALSGVTWKESDQGKAAGNYGGVKVHYLGRAQLVANKRKTARKKDLADLEALGEG